MPSNSSQGTIAIHAEDNDGNTALDRVIISGDQDMGRNLYQLGAQMSSRQLQRVQNIGHLEAQ
jgi:ankyrin repeat protein